MSTRCNVKIIDNLWNKKHELWFYRHSDGYPDGALPTLKKFMKWLVDGKIRNNIGQASGWLILLGAIEYDTIPSTAFNGKKDYQINFDEPKDWKCGAYEPTTGKHEDIEFLYILNLTKKTISYKDNGKEIILTEFNQ